MYMPVHLLLSYTDFVSCILQKYKTLLLPSISADLKQVAQAVAGIELQDRFVTMIFALFDEDCKSLMTYFSTTMFASARYMYFICSDDVAILLSSGWEFEL